MKGWPIVVVLLLCLILAGSLACNPFGGGKEETTQQLVEVVRGDLTVTISGSGNIEASDEMKLTFGIGGRVDKIYVEEDDEVSQGDVLAKLETDDLELALTQAEVTYNQAKVAVTEAEVAVTRAEVAVTQAEVTYNQAQVAVTQAEINLKNAEIALEQTIKTSTLSDIKVAQAEVDVAKRDLEEALWTLSKYDPGTVGFEGYQKRVIQAEARLNTAEDRLDAMLAGTDTKEVASKKQQVEAAQQSLESTRRSLESTRQSLESTRQSLELAKLSPELARQYLELTKQSLEQARKQLDKVTIVAPFNSVITNVYVDEGDTISTATKILYLVDPSRMELKVQVDEIDIPEVELGQRAIIEVDALPALPFEGNVRSISLLPTVEAGVIVYDVKIDLSVPEGGRLRAGMSATADIIINERSNVLLVPNRAIKEDSEGNPVVEVIVNGQTESRTVVIGISDGFQTVIVDGLEEGEVVIEKRAKK